MFNLVTFESIIMSEIDNNNYIETLIYSLLKHNIISNLEYEQIIINLLFLLDIRIKKYTGFLTSSVPIMVAKNINDSNIFVIGLYLRKKTIEESVNILLHNNMENTFMLARKNIDSYILKTKLFYEVVFLNNIITTANYFYNATLKDGIKGFFKMYNPSYDAKNYIINVDYDAYLKIPRLEGIEFINKYLEYINYENLFCKKFDHIKIEKVLVNIHFNYQQLPINIFECILTTTIILEYLKINIFSLDLSLVDPFILYNDYNLNKTNYLNKLKYSFNNIKSILKLNGNLVKYVDKCSINIIKKIINHTKDNTLEVLLKNN